MLKELTDLVTKRRRILRMLESDKRDSQAQAS